MANLRRRQFERAFSLFEASLAKTSSVKQLRKTWRELEKSLGTFEKVDPPKLRVQRGHRIYLFRCHGSLAAGNVKVMTRLVKGKPRVAGFFITGSGLKGEGKGH